MCGMNSVANTLNSVTCPSVSYMICVYDKDHMSALQL